MYSPIEAKLIVYALAQDDDGYDYVEVKKETEVFVITKSVGYNEFYKAYEVGIKPRMTASMYAWEYDESCYEGKEPSHIIIEEKLYRIVRTYQTDMDHTDLTLEEDVRNMEGQVKKE